MLTGGAVVLEVAIDCPLTVEPVDARELAAPEVVVLCPLDVVLGAVTEEGEEVLTEEEPDAELPAAEVVVTAAGVEMCWPLAIVLAPLHCDFDGAGWAAGVEAWPW